MQKLDVFGDTYIAQHVEQEAVKMAEEATYRCYITDILKVIASSEFVGAKVEKRYCELLPHEEKPQKSAKQVKDNARKALANLRRKGAV